MSGTSLGHTPAGEKWEFDESVASCFEDMLDRSIPEYREVRSLATHFAAKAARSRPGSAIIDLGCSDGLQIAALYEALGDSFEYVGCEISEAMRERAVDRLRGISELSLPKLDLRYDFPRPDSKASVVSSFLTLQFIPIEHRWALLQKSYDVLEPGGVFILVEKILGGSPVIDAAFRERYRLRKIEQGYSEEEVNRKALSLEGVLVPVSAEMNESMLSKAGFSDVECFWRWCNFAAWIAVR